MSIDPGASVRSSLSSHTFLSQSEHSGGSDGGGTWTSSMLSSSTKNDRPSDEEIERMFAQTAVNDPSAEKTQFHVSILIMLQC